MATKICVTMAHMVDPSAFYSVFRSAINAIRLAPLDADCQCNIIERLFALTVDLQYSAEHNCYYTHRYGIAHGFAYHSLLTCRDQTIFRTQDDGTLWYDAAKIATEQFIFSVDPRAMLIVMMGQAIMSEFVTEALKDALRLSGFQVFDLYGTDQLIHRHSSVGVMPANGKFTISDHAIEHVNGDRDILLPILQKHDIPCKSSDITIVIGFISNGK